MRHIRERIYEKVYLAARGPEQGVDLGIDLVIRAVLERNGPSGADRCAGTASPATRRRNLGNPVPVDEWNIKGADPNACQTCYAPVGVHRSYRREGSHLFPAQDLYGLLAGALAHGQGFGQKSCAMGRSSQENSLRSELHRSQLDMSLQKEPFLRAGELENPGHLFRARVGPNPRT